MKFVCLLASVFIAVCVAEVYDYDVDENELLRHPEWYTHNLVRQRRQVNLEHKVGQNGRVFGQLDGQGESAYGKLGYKHDIINDGRGKLTGQAYGARVLSPYGNSNHLGGGLDWKSDHSRASLDISKQIHGPTSLDAAAGYRHQLNKNSDISASGTYSHTFGHGRPNYGGRIEYNHRF